MGDRPGVEIFPAAIPQGVAETVTQPPFTFHLSLAPSPLTPERPPD
jgi:hypothetical protein